MVKVSVLLLFFGCGSTLWAQEKPSTTVPWDTLVAEIQVIDALAVPDSLKNGYLNRLFDRYRVAAEDYRRFHEHFLSEPVEYRKTFISKVRDILQFFIQERRYENAPPESTGQ